MMSLILWQASFFPALGQGSDDALENPINGNVKIVVKRGDTLWDLAQSHHTTMEEIVKLNKLKSPDKISEGESLLVPNKAVQENPQKIEDISVVEDKPRIIEDISRSDNTANPSWWVLALRRRVVQVGTIFTQSSNIQQQESTIPTYEIFVNPLETPTSNTLTDVQDLIQKKTVLETASSGEESQILSRSLGRLVSKEEVDILTRVIHGEARGENFEGQVAVGAVVLNRLKDPRFPKTIRAVVYQSGAFTAVDDKQIQLDPNDQSYKAAEAALSGQDPTNGALFYFNPRLATDRWIKSRSVIKRIGNHTFSI